MPYRSTSVVMRALCLGLFLTLSACAESTSPTSPTPPSSASEPSASAEEPEAALPAGASREEAILFVPAEEELGLEFRHDYGGSGERYMVETIGAGGGLADFDGDGDLDAYLVQGGPLPRTPGVDAPPNRLYRNLGDGRFEDITELSGAGDGGYGMGTCFGDVDNDGDEDIYVANFGPDVLLRNTGDAVFEDVTAAAGIDNPSWASSCAFADYDQDGALDLYVVNYLDFSLETHKRCGTPDMPQYCHPDEYRGVADRLFRGLGDGRFEDVTDAAGIGAVEEERAKGLGVIWLDFDSDGDQDIYVSNDSTRNFLHRNEGDGTFQDVALTSGVAFNADGDTEAGMGIAAGDVGEDGWIDLFVTHLDFETNTLYRNLGDGFFDDETKAAGLAAPSIGRVGFGTLLFDADLDGDEDLFVANGHIIDNIAQSNPSLSFAQPDQVFENLGDGRFDDVSSRAGAGLALSAVSRGAAAGDLDGDGDLDLLVTRNDGPATLLRNESRARGESIMLDLRSRQGGRPAIGARVMLYSDDDRFQVREVRAGSGYQSQSDTRLHFGLGDGQRVDRVLIRWPEGGETELDGAEISLGETTVIREAADGAADG